MSKKFLIFLIMIFIMAVGTVSAQDINDGAVVSENQDLNDLSTISVDSETADILTDAAHARFVIDNSTANWEISVLDDNDTKVNEGEVYISLQNYSVRDWDLSYQNTIDLPLYEYYDYFPGNMIFIYSGENYTVDNQTIFVDALTDTIVASDVVGEDSFNATFYDEQGNPLRHSGFKFTISSDDYSDTVYSYTDENGVVVINKLLFVGNYTVYVENGFTGQHKSFWWNITKEDDSKMVSIAVSQVGCYLIVSAADKDGNNVTSGSFKFTSENGGDLYRESLDESFVSFSLYLFDFNEYPQNIRIDFTSDEYYSANATVHVAKLNDTIAAGDVVDELSFSATFLDSFGNPLDGEEVFFEIYNDDYYNDFYPVTDSEGVAVINQALPIGNYTVSVANIVTGQYKSFWWNITEEDDSKFVSIAVSRVGGVLIVSAVDKDGNNVTNGEFKFSSEYGGTSFMYLEDESFVSQSLYYFGFSYPQYIYIHFTSDDYYPANARFYVDKLNDTIAAGDVVDEFSFNATFFDSFGNPLDGERVFFEIYNDDYYYSFYPATGSEGVVVISLVLPIGNYTVSVANIVTGQHKYYWWNISKEDESKFVSIAVSQVGSDLIVSAVDKDGNNVTTGIFIFTSEHGEELSSDLMYESFVSLSLYTFDFDDYPQNISIDFNSFHYYSANATIYVGKLNDTIIAHDVVDEFSFNVTFLDEKNNPLNGTSVYLHVYTEDRSYSEVFYPVTDSNGVVSINIDLSVGNYTVEAYNPVTYQLKYFWWNITKDKNASINVTQDGFIFIIEAFDNEGNKINDGFIDILCIKDNLTDRIEINNGTAIFDYIDSYWDYDEGENTLGFTLINDNYYPVKTIGNFTLRNSIDVNASRSTIFNATFTDIDGNPLNGQEVLFTVKSYRSGEIIENITRTTDANGFAYIEKTDGYYEYFVFVTNLVTHQYKGAEWFNKKEFEICPVAYYDNETGYYVIENETLTFNVSPDATGAIDIIGNGRDSWDIDLSGNEFTITLTESGLNSLYIFYYGDENYSSKVIEELNVFVKENASVDIDAPAVREGQNTTIEVTLPEDATGNIGACVNGTTYTAPVKDGKATISIPDLAVGNYTVPVTYSGDDKYNPVTKEVNITVEEDKSDIISAPDVTKYYRGPESFVVTVTDYQGNALANKTVKITINGVEYTRTTDENGTASMALGLNSGVYNVTSTVDNKTVNSVVTILTTVNGTDVVKVFRNGTQYYATFRNSQGNYLMNGTVVNFNINGVMYERKVSGDKGLARLNINLEQGEYIITAINPETGENAANNITVLALLTENNDVIKYYRNATQYTVKVLGEDGNPVGAGVSVKFNINGVFYERTTNESGIAKLNLNLQPGDYIITAEYEGCRVSNNITILPVLSAEDFTKKYGTPDPFVATLVDGQGKPYADEKVEFNINGVFYYRTTASNGQVKLNINLMPGEYIITSSYNGANIANRITISG